jgi:PHP family Zn ribbon phosphoesterase
MVKEIRSAEEIAEDQPRSRKMLTEAEAAELFRVSRATLRFWRGRGRGPRYYKIGGGGRRGRIKYRKEDVDAYLVGAPVETLDSLRAEGKYEPCQ